MGEPAKPRKGTSVEGGVPAKCSAVSPIEPAGKKREETANALLYRFRVIPAQCSPDRLNTAKPTTFCGGRRATTTLNVMCGHTLAMLSKAAQRRQEVFFRRFTNGIRSNSFHARNSYAMHQSYQGLRIPSESLQSSQTFLITGLPLSIMHLQIMVSLSRNIASIENEVKGSSRRCELTHSLNSR